MSNKEMTAVEYLVEQLIPKALSAEQYYHIQLALQMEATKQQKYDKMLAMLESCVLAFEQMGMKESVGITQLIKEAKEL